MDARTQVIKAAKKLQSERGNPVLILDLKDIQRPNCLELQNAIHGKHYANLDVILQTPGGDIDAAYCCVKLLRYSSDIINIIVPLYAKSAGTLICLGGDSILMTTLSELGPLDTQITEDQEGTSPSPTSALNGFKALEQVQVHTIETLDIATKLILQRSGLKISEAVSLAAKFAGGTSGTLYHQLDPKKIGEYARALEIGEAYGIRLLTRYMRWAEEKADELVKRLVKSYPSHSFVIDVDELASLGLPAQAVADHEEAILDEMRLALIHTNGDTIELLEMPSAISKADDSAPVPVARPVRKEKEHAKSPKTRK